MRVLFICADVIGSQMAGPAIRYWELARALAPYHEVTLAAPNIPDIEPNGFKLSSLRQHSLREIVKNCDIVITQFISPLLAIFAKKYKVKIILDAYDPLPLEHLEIYKAKTLSSRNRQNNKGIKKLVFDFRMADAFICAHPRQRDLWIGLLMMLKRITPQVYDLDNSLNNFIEVVPFGLSEKPPIKTGAGLRQQFGLKDSDKVLLWGGGIWNWFDPLTLIQGVEQLKHEGLPVHLVFMGIKHPNNAIPQMEMTNRAVELARKLGLLDKQVFFNYGWTPYDSRQNFLLESDIGVSTHFNTLETRFAFRTRILDYLWAGLPMLVTEGDHFAEVVKRHNLGMVVPYSNPSAVAASIKTMLSQPLLLRNMKDNCRSISHKYQWNNLAQPLNRLITKLAEQPAYTSYKNLIIESPAICQNLFKSLIKKTFIKLFKL